MIVTDTTWSPDLSKAGRSKYMALAQAIREGIVSKQFKVGEKLPTVRALAEKLSITPGTVSRAYQILIDEGRLEAGVGRGTFVAGTFQADELPKWAPAMLDAVNKPERAHFLSPKVPDMGQVKIIRDGMVHVANTMPAEQLLRYPTRETDLAARQAFMACCPKDIIGPATEEDVTCAHGGQSAIVMVLQTLLHGPSPVIAVDELSYGGFRSAAMTVRSEVVHVPWDDGGARVDVLENLIKTKSVQCFFTSSEVNNPLALSTSPARRVEIARLAQRYGVHVIDDHCYRIMQTEHIGPSYRSLMPDLGWYISSPSKTLTPSLRIGFAVPPKAWAPALARTATYNSFGVSRMVTDLYAYVMAHPDLPDVIERVRARVAQDVRAAVNILGSYKMNWSEDVPFFWLELPVGWRAGAFCAAADAEGVLVKPGEDFAHRDGKLSHAVRIAINGQMPHEEFVAAMETLRRLLQTQPEQITV